MSTNARVEELLERLSDASREETHGASDAMCLDERTRSLAVIAAAVCTGATSETLHPLVESALQSGATAEEILGVLVTVAPSAGAPRVVAMAPRLALALGYDVDAAFEHD